MAPKNSIYSRGLVLSLAISALVNETHPWYLLFCLLYCDPRDTLQAKEISADPNGTTTL